MIEMQIYHPDLLIKSICMRLSLLIRPTSLMAVLFFFVAVTSNAREAASSFQSENLNKQENQKLLLVTMAGVGVITAWGIIQWDYFTQTPHAKSEGWFANDTKEGGADKLGHMYISYLGTHGFSYLYEKWNVPQDKAAVYGGISSFLILGYMELGDSFSEYGFSYEDLIANALGSMMGYFLYTSPDLASKIDFRWEYGFEPNGSDFTTDYENSKYLFALKLNGFTSMQSSFLKHVELLFGYYTRGFSDLEQEKERNIFLGLGFNLTDLLYRHSYKKTATILRYIQVPYTYFEYTKDFNQ